MNSDRRDTRPDTRPDTHPASRQAPRPGSGTDAWPAPRPRATTAATALPPGTPAPPDRPAPPPPAPSVSAASAAQDERLARLAARRAGADRPGGRTTPRRHTGAAGTAGTAGIAGIAGIAGDATDHGRAQASSRRAHPAGRARASAVAVSLVTTVGLATYLHETSAASTGGQAATISGSIAPSATPETAATAATAATADTSDASAATPATVAPPATSAATATADPTASATGLADGTYTGDTVTMKWGPVQVAISVTGGQITSVDVLQYPTADRKSVLINEQAVPTLIAETLAAQSADVDTISGATYTTDGYRASLQTAIDDARAAATAG